MRFGNVIVVNEKRGGAWEVMCMCGGMVCHVQERANRGCEVTACACGVRSPYSSVVEHPLSKRKVGSSILPGGIDIRRPRTDEVVCFLW